MGPQGTVERERPATGLKDDQRWEQNLENLENREEMKKRNYWNQGLGVAISAACQRACLHFWGSKNTTELAAVVRCQR